MPRILNHLNFWIPALFIGFFVLIGLVLGILFVAMLAVSRWEKQRVRDFVPVTPGALPPPSPYFQVMNDAARELGFQPGGMFGQNRESGMYRSCLSLWLSPDQKLLLCIAGGKVARVNYKKTTLISMRPDGTSIVSMDSFGSEDLSGTREVEVLMNADLPELTRFHQSRLAVSGREVRPLAADNLLGEFENWRQRSVDRLVAKGLATFITPDRNVWQFTSKGAWMNALIAQTSGVKKGRAQKERMHIKRPGG